MMNSGRETLFALLSAGGRWDACRLAGLTVRPDGQVELARVPAVTPSSLAPPAAVAPSGLALDARCGLYISAALERQVIRVSLDCGDRLVFSGDDALEPPLPAAPAGLCTGPFGWLFAADPGRGAVLVFHPRELSLRDEWRAGLAAPVAVASDRDRGLFVLDQAAGQVLRFDPWAGRIARLPGGCRPMARASRWRSRRVGKESSTSGTWRAGRSWSSVPTEARPGRPWRQAPSRRLSRSQRTGCTSATGRAARSSYVP